MADHNAFMRKSDGNDKDITIFRSGDRVFCLNGRWFYQTREADHGPFASREAAERDLTRYIEEMSFFDSVRKEGGVTSPNQNPDFANFSLVDKD